MKRTSFYEGLPAILAPALQHFREHRMDGHLAWHARLHPLHALETNAVAVADTKTPKRLRVWFVVLPAQRRALARTNAREEQDRV
jgi:hypothetical protein